MTSPFLSPEGEEKNDHDHVFVVAVEWAYSTGYEILGVFGSRELAEQCADERRQKLPPRNALGSDDEYVDIIEHPVTSSR